MNVKERELYLLKRRAKKIRLSEVAKYCGCSVSTLSRYENRLKDLDAEIEEKYRKCIEYYQIRE